MGNISTSLHLKNVININGLWSGKMTMRRTNIYLPLRMLQKLRDEAKALGISVAELIRRIIDLYFGGKECK